MYGYGLVIIGYTMVAEGIAAMQNMSRRMGKDKSKTCAYKQEHE